MHNIQVQQPLANGPWNTNKICCANETCGSISKLEIVVGLATFFIKFHDVIMHNVQCTEQKVQHTPLELFQNLYIFQNFPGLLSLRPLSV